MALFYGKNATEILAGRKVPAPDHGGKVRVVNEIVEIGGGFPVGSQIVIAEIPAGARVLGFEMGFLPLPPTVTQIPSGCLIDIGTEADQIKYDADLEFYPAGQHSGQRPFRFGNIWSTGIALLAPERIVMTVHDVAIPAVANCKSYFSIRTYYVAG